MKENLKKVGEPIRNYWGYGFSSMEFVRVLLIFGAVVDDFRAVACAGVRETTPTPLEG